MTVDQNHPPGLRSLGEGGSDPIRDEAGVPVEWTLLKIGDNRICQEGKSANLRLDPEGMQQILAYFHEKGEEIPIDSEHFLFSLAREKQLDESETLKLFPGGVAAMGFGKLFLAGENLRIRVKWNPAAYKMLQEKIYKYFSPVIRGLGKGPLRLTSVAMTNVPAINQLPALAARAEKPTSVRLSGLDRKERKMSKLEKALGRLLGCDTVALEAENKEEDQDKIACEVEEKADLIEQVKKLLGLPEDANLDAVIAALKGMGEKAASADEKQQKLDELAASAEKEAHALQVKRGIDERKLAAGDMEYANSLDSKALCAYLDHAAPKIPAPVSAAKREEKDDIAALTAEDRAACRRLNIAEDKFLATKKERMK